MTIRIGLPQGLLLALYMASLVINCVSDGKEEGTSWYGSVISIAIELALLAWGGFFS